MKMKEKTVVLKNGANVTVRTASPAEVDALLDCFKTVCAETSFLSYTAEEAAAITVQQEQDFVSDYEKSKRNIFIAAYSQGKAIATCSVNAVSERVRESHRAELGIAIRREFWNLGLGSALLNTAIDFAHKVGYDQIELNVVPENVNALMLYRKFGFEPVGSFPRAQKVDGNYRNIIRMVKYLNE